MMRNRRLSRAIADLRLGIFISMLEYKSELHGAEIAKIDRWYASSKVCSGCGNKKAVLSLSMREYRCHACGLVKACMDRDENAAKNIETEAARSADSLNGRGDEVRPGHRVPSATSVKRLLELSDLPSAIRKRSRTDSKDRSQALPRRCGRAIPNLLLLHTNTSASMHPRRQRA